MNSINQPTSSSEQGLAIDLNCDVGEGFGAYSLGDDAAILDQVSSANIACGFHAGDPAKMHRTVTLCVERGVAIGAHPGLPDLVGFGRRPLAVTPEEAFEMVTYQIGALFGFVRAAGGRLTHVKPHGALYNMAAKDLRLAKAIARAVHSFDQGLILYGLSGSELIAAGEAVGLATASEVFADRGYQPDGSLTPRSVPGAVIADPHEASRRVIEMVTRGSVLSVTGQPVSLRAETVCIHGDTPDAALHAKLIRSALKAAGIPIRSPQRD